MKILLLAPQPFYQERGTPIAVRLALEVLAERPNTQITLLTYHEGDTISIPNVKFERIIAPGLNNIGPGISVKKILCDIIFMFSVFGLLWKNRKEQFQIIHAVEESVFIALLVKLFVGIPYIYDMDSSLSLQVYEKWSWSRVLLPAFRWLEARAMRNSLAVVPVCYALYEIAEQAGSRTTQILHDISLLNLHASDDKVSPSIKNELNLQADSLIALYIGNLERYQGIDLLLKAYATIQQEAGAKAHIVVIGGHKEHIDFYLKMSEELGIAAQTHFMGPRPVSALKSLLLQADILLSPRTLGNNTPMKIYSYLHSGVPIVATALPTHTQVLDSSVAFLAEPSSTAYGQALLAAFTQPEIRKNLGKAAESLALEKYTFEIFRRDLNKLYDNFDSISLL